jgi:mannose-6-phosphate isomerase-like protein (cupin superfamily)
LAREVPGKHDESGKAAQLFRIRRRPMIAANPQDLLDTLESRPDRAQQFVVAFKRGSVTVEMYAPRLVDGQSPHEQDELYCIHRGEGEIVVAGERRIYSTGDMIFVPARVEHRFENFSADFATWVIFYGPMGGETVGVGP